MKAPASGHLRLTYPSVTISFASKPKEQCTGHRPSGYQAKNVN